MKAQFKFLSFRDRRGEEFFSLLALQLSVSQKFSLQPFTTVVTLGDKTYFFLCVVPLACIH